MNIAIRSARACALLLIVLSPTTVSTSRAQDTAAMAGVLWEVTSQVTMEGMPFSPPAQTHKRCLPADWREPPGAGDDERGCVNSAFERFANTVTWTSICEGPPAMSGQGKIVFEDDAGRAYTGTINYASDEGNVVINLSGRVVGSCDKPR